MPIERRRLMGLTWFTQNMNGMSIRAIVRQTHHNHRTVTKYIKEAVESLTEEAQASVIRDLIPKAAQLYMAAMDAEIERIKKGGVPNVELADRLMRGMYVLEDPLGRKLSTPLPEPGQLIAGEPETLFGFIGGRMPAPAKLAAKPLPKVIDVPTAKQEDRNGKGADEVHRDGSPQDDNVQQ